MKIERIEKKKVVMAGSMHRSHDVALLMERAIFNGKYAIGQKFPSEAELCAEYSVSRTVIREALKQLTGRGLVVTRNGSGSYVSSCSPNYLGDTLRRIGGTGDYATQQELLELWGILQAGAIRAFVGANASGRIQTLENALASLQRAGAANDAEQFVRAQTDFYRALANGLGNDLLLEFYRGVESVVAKQSEALAANAEARQNLVKSCEAVLAAIRAVNEPQAGEKVLEQAYESIRVWQAQLKL